MIPISIFSSNNIKALVQWTYLLHKSRNIQRFICKRTFLKFCKLDLLKDTAINLILSHLNSSSSSVFPSLFGRPHFTALRELTSAVSCWDDTFDELAAWQPRCFPILVRTTCLAFTTRKDSAIGVSFYLHFHSEHVSQHDVTFFSSFSAVHNRKWPFVFPIR